MVCPKCNDKGWLPFKRQDGTIVTGIRADCECKEFGYDEARDALPEDIDFPVSYDFYRWHQHSYLGLPDPGATEPLPIEPVKVEHYHHHYHMKGAPELEKQIKELRGFMKHHNLKERERTLKNEQERINKQKPKSKYD